MTPLLTALWVIAITNAVNLIDGLDGLAAGVVAIASGALAVYGFHLQGLGNLPADNIGPLIAVITCGICIGFLPHNFHPAKIFMGDAGALLLGLLMAASTMLIGGRSAGPADVTAGAARPTSSSRPCSSPSSSSASPSSTWPSPSSAGRPTGPGFATPDKNHLHHRLLRLGHGHRRSVLILWAWTALLSGFILFPLYVSSVNAFIPFGAAALGVILYTLFHPTFAGSLGPTPTEEAVAGQRPAAALDRQSGSPATRPRSNGSWRLRSPIAAHAVRRPGPVTGR